MKFQGQLANVISKYGQPETRTEEEKVREEEAECLRKILHEPCAATPCTPFLPPRLV